MVKRLNYNRLVNTKHSLNQGLISRWKYLPNLGGGGYKLYDIVDGWKKSNNGTLNSGTTWAGSLGRPGGYGSINFNGTSGTISTGCNLSTVGTGPILLAAWVRCTMAVGTNVSTIFSNYDYNLTGGGQFVILRIGDRANPYLAMYVGNDAAVDSCVGTTALNDSTWHHVVGLRDSGGTLRLYIDGKPHNSAAGTPRTCTNTRGLDIGMLFHGSGLDWFAGNIDDGIVSFINGNDSIAKGIYDASVCPDDPTLNWIGMNYYIAPAVVVVSPPPQVILQGQTFNALQAAGGVLLANG